eukprot:Nk52_evm1s2256 gene=Nk52_evmTU1s2256
MFSKSVILFGIFSLFVFTVSCSDANFISQRIKNLARLELSEMNDELDRADFEDWKEKYGKVYDQNSDEQLAFRTWKENREFIRQHSASSSATYDLSLNKFADLSWDEFRDIYLGKMEEPKKKTGSSHPSPASLKSIPNDVNWATKNNPLGRSLVSQNVRNQGMCGSCWAHSGVQTLEAMLQRKEGNSFKELSVQDVVACSRSDGCQGGLPEWVYDYSEEKGGLPTEMSYPTTNTDNDCQRVRSQRYGKATGHVDLPQSEESLYDALANVGVVSIAMAVDRAFQFYSGGIYNGPCAASLNHAIIAVGYRKDEYFVIKNSWGSSWGEDGYAKMASGKDLCGITSHMTYPLL